MVDCSRFDSETDGVGVGGDVENVGGVHTDAAEEGGREEGSEVTAEWLLMLILLRMLLQLLLALANTQTVRADFEEYAGRRVKGRMVLEVRYRKSENGEATVIPNCVFKACLWEERAKVVILYMSVWKRR